MATDSHVWSENYDRELDDIFAIQDDIAACILAEMCAVYAVFYERDDSRQRNYEWQARSQLASDALSRLLPGKAESFLASGYLHEACDKHL